MNTRIGTTMTALAAGAGLVALGGGALAMAQPADVAPPVAAAPTIPDSASTAPSAPQASADDAPEFQPGTGRGFGRGGRHGGAFGMGPMGGPDMGRPGAGGPLGQPLHGDMVVDEDGTYVTVRMQSGEVTATSATSISVKSDDGFTATYVITEETVFGHPRLTGDDASAQQAAKDAITVGDDVRVRATVTGDDVIADHIREQAAPAQAPLDDA